MSAPETSRRETRILTGIFLAALAVHLWAVTYNWKIPYMAGHEFRQAQTAITTYYIDRENNFGLLYETPILGKPWVSILMEVPFYEWTVVGVSRLTKVPHFMAARGVSTVCFYLMLPAIYLLLGRLGLTRPRRLLALALVLTCPVYIYYTRAFLMDSMALMFCAWFLLGFVRTMDERKWSWLAVTIVAGTMAALIKSAILAVWLWPAAAYGAWLLWRDLRAGQGWRAPVKTILWGAATVVIAMGALRAWIVYTDPLKGRARFRVDFHLQESRPGQLGVVRLQAAVLPRSVGLPAEMLGRGRDVALGARTHPGGGPDPAPRALARAGHRRDLLPGAGDVPLRLRLPGLLFLLVRDLPERGVCLRVAGAGRFANPALGLRSLLRSAFCRAAGGVPAELLDRAEHVGRREATRSPTRSAISRRRAP